MSTDLRQALEDLTSDNPPTSAPVEVARSAWKAGQRQRRKRRFSAAVAVVVVVLAVGFLSASILRLPGSVQPADGSGSSVVHGYPERIGHQLWVPDLPAAPGPMSLLMQRVDHRETYDQSAGWDAVNASGHRWHLGDLFDGNGDNPVLSPDGRYLGYLAGVHGPWVIQDLVTGRSVQIASVGSGLSTDQTRFQTQGQAPAFWSPDDRHIFLIGFGPGLRSGGLLLGLDGSVSLVHHRGLPAGWVGSSTLAWLEWQSHGSKSVQASLQLTGLSGVLERTIALPGRFGAQALSQWSGVVSPDGRQLAVTAGDSEAHVRRYSLSTGKRIGRSDSGLEIPTPCELAWDHSAPVVPMLTGDNVTPEILGASGPRPIVAIDPRLGPECIVWASNALNGSRNDMLFGLSMAWWTWWWREFVVGIVLAAFLTLVGWRWAVVRRRRAPYKGKETGVGAPG